MTGAFQPGQDAGPPAVMTSQLTKRFRGITALDRVDVRVPDGAVYVLVGENGAGKSTLMKVLMNLEPPDSGSARIFGLDTAARGPEARAQIGYLSERAEPGYRWMTCGRLLEHLAAFHPTWDRPYADHLVRALGVETGRGVGGLSKGEARRLQLVMALAHRPLLLLLDEPTSGLDARIRRRVLTLLTEHLADTPTTILIATHQIHEVASLVDHIGVLRRGVLVAQMRRDELQQTVRRYRLEVPEGWEAPTDLLTADARGSRAGREIQLSIVGDEEILTQRLARSGAHVREVVPLSVEDAALAFLPEEDAP